MGKTKVAYDIGRRHAYSIIMRIVEIDTLTLPRHRMEAILNGVRETYV